MSCSPASRTSRTRVERPAQRIRAVSNHMRTAGMRRTPTTTTSPTASPRRLR